MWYNSGNYDEDQFPEPRRFDIRGTTPRPT